MSEENKTAFVSGHTDLTNDEFETHYKPLLDKAIKNNNNFIMAAAHGTDLRALEYILGQNVPPSRVTVYLHYNYTYRKEEYEKKGINVKTGYSSHGQRDEEMTNESDYDIAWLRPETEARKIYGQNWKKDRISATEQNLLRRLQQ